MLCALALILAMDVSGSIDAEEFDMQVQGTAAALRDPRTARAVNSAPYGRIAVAVTQWAEGSEVVIPWVVVDAGGLPLLADAVEQMPRRGGYMNTDVDAALRHAVGLMAAAPCGDRKVVDVSGDGPHNAGAYTGAGREAADAVGIVINGLAIVTPAEADLAQWYRDHVQTGFGSFVKEARGFQDVGAAMISKLSLEIANIRVEFAGVEK